MCVHRLFGSSSKRLSLGLSQESGLKEPLTVLFTKSELSKDLLYIGLDTQSLNRVNTIETIGGLLRLSPRLRLRGSSNLAPRDFSLYRIRSLGTISYHITVQD